MTESFSLVFESIPMTPRRLRKGPGFFAAAPGRTLSGVIVFATGAFALTLFGFVFNGWDALQFELSETRETMGRVISIGNDYSIEINDEPAAVIAFSYNDGTTGTAMIGSLTTVDDEVILHCMEARAAGATLPVTYVPDDPELATVADGSLSLLPWWGYALAALPMVVGALLLRSGLAARRQLLRVLLFGMPTTGEVIEVRRIAHVRVNNRNPYEVVVRFDADIARDQAVKVRTLRREITDATVAVGDPATVLYGQRNPTSATLPAMYAIEY